MSVPQQDWSEATRFAIYYAPPRESAWWQAGCAWLGRDPETGETLAPPQLAGLGQPLDALTVAPRRYGWHGTFVPPFRLAPGVTPEALFAAAEQWALRQTRFDANVEAAMLGRFVALRPADEAGETALRELAASALRALGSLRAAQTPAELAKRLDAPLTPRQRTYVEEWGYPYVFEEFRFHMTLSDSLKDAQTCAHLVDAWNAQMRGVPALPVEGAALFVEPQPGAPFALWRRLPFAEARA
jgi:putative phosphonate metabolism protein